MIHRVTRWNGAVAATVVLGAAGVAANAAGLLVAAAVPLTYVAYGALATAPPLESNVATTRELDATAVPPGQPVTVTLTVANTGERVLPDVRVVDRVPERLRVLDGTPRGVATLRPGEELTLMYRVLARRGSFAFGPPRVRSRGFAASVLATADVPPAGDDRLVCRLDADAPPLADRASGYAGQVATDDPGEGTEFHSTREYVPGDPMARVDWRHYAKHGELATIAYRAHRVADVVLVLDVRAPTRAVAGPGHPSGLELCGYAATRALAELAGAGQEVGVAVLGGSGAVADRWLPPGAGRAHRAQARAVLRRAVDAAQAPERSPSGEDGGSGPESGAGSAARDRAASEIGSRTAPGIDGRVEVGAADGPTDAEAADRPVQVESGDGTGTCTDAAMADEAREIAARLSPGTQVILCSPVLDEGPLAALDVFGAFGLARSLLAPDVVADNTVSGQLATVRRRTWLARCQASGARVVDWRRGTPLLVALDAAFAAEGALGGEQTRAADGRSGWS